MARKKKAEEQKPDITAGCIVAITGNVRLSSGELTDAFDGEQASVVSIDSETVNLTVSESKKVVSTWIGNVEYVCGPIKYSIGDLVSLKPVKITGIEIDHWDKSMTYEVTVGDGEFYVEEDQISQLLSQGLS